MKLLDKVRKFFPRKEDKDSLKVQYPNKVIRVGVIKTNTSEDFEKEYEFFNEFEIKEANEIFPIIVRFKHGKFDNEKKMSISIFIRDGLEKGVHPSNIFGTCLCCL